MTSQARIMVREVAALLASRKFPVRVVYGPERVARDGRYHPAIVIDRDRKTSEPVETAHGSQRNPRRMLTRYLALEARVYAHSGVAGARFEDHEGECDLYVDGLLVALDNWMSEAKAAPFEVQEARYLSADDLKLEYGEEWPGVCYRIRFRLARAVLARDYTGAARPVTQVAGTGNRVDIRLNGSAEPPEPVEIP